MQEKHIPGYIFFLVIPIIIGILLVVFASSKEVTIPKEWETHTDTTLGYSVSYPRGWWSIERDGVVNPARPGRPDTDVPSEYFLIQRTMRGASSCGSGEYINLNGYGAYDSDWEQGFGMSYYRDVCLIDLPVVIRMAVFSDLNGDIDPNSKKMFEKMLDTVLFSGNYVEEVGTTEASSENINTHRLADTSYAYLFEPADSSEYSNIVGYFAGGAFAWYVPDWVVPNWEVDNQTYDDRIIMTPIRREDSSAFSDIVMAFRDSTERYNAAYIYEYVTDTIARDDTGEVNLIIKEVLLNKHQDGTLKMVLNTDTLIYHIQYDAYGERYDLYYMDGDDKTLEVTFHAQKDIFHQFDIHIRDLVESISALEELRG